MSIERLLSRKRAELISLIVMMLFIVALSVLKIADFYRFQGAFDVLVCLKLVGFLVLGGVFAMVAAPLLHECGHLVFGLVTGYRLSMISFFQWAIVFGKDGLHLRRFISSGFLGRCLMSPPDLQHGRLTYAAYYLGGVVFNALACIGATVMLFMADVVSGMAPVCIMFAAVNLRAIVINALPCSDGFAYSDGASIAVLHRNIQAEEALWMQLKVADAQAQGLRMRDMPNEWFERAERIAPVDYISSALLLYPYSLQLDSLNIQKAAESIRELAHEPGKLSTMGRCIAKNDYKYCEALIGAPIDEMCSSLRIDSVGFVEDDAFEWFRGWMASDPSVLRTDCTVSLLCDRDDEKATYLLHDFQRECLRYPIDAVVELENELMRAAWLKHERIVLESNRTNASG